MDEIRNRLEFLVAVGLEYLSLERSAATLSGGEAQRIRLATQIGSKLRGVLYVLDEPSIGLHPRDNDRLLDSLAKLRDLGNTVLVVEHDAETIERADYVIDLGPGAGRLGGQLVAQGTPLEIAKNPAFAHRPVSLGRARDRDARRTRRKPGTRAHRRFTARPNTICKNIDVEFPLGLFIAGHRRFGQRQIDAGQRYSVSRRGESRVRIARRAGRARLHHGPRPDRQGDRDRSVAHRPHAALESRDLHAGLHADPRSVSRMLPESRERGYKPGRFSFNVKGGRCEACQGDGLKRIEMNFLPDVYVTCDVCRGRRYNHETLQVKYKGYSIADLLEMPVEDALKLLENIPQIKAKLETLVESGWDICTWASRRPRFRAAKRSASSWRTSSASGRPARRSIFWMSPPPACTSRTCASCSTCCRAWWIWAILWW